jgi:hypothetical protein
MEVEKKPLSALWHYYDYGVRAHRDHQFAFFAHYVYEGILGTAGVAMFWPGAEPLLAKMISRRFLQFANAWTAFHQSFGLAKSIARTGDRVHRICNRTIPKPTSGMCSGWPARRESPGKEFVKILDPPAIRPGEVKDSGQEHRYVFATLRGL